MRGILMLGIAALLFQLPGCAQPPETPTGATEEAAPVHGKITDLAEFERFIATRPTPTQFRAHYPDVLLVVPGMVTTKELRGDNSRYFAQLDAGGHITGGRFQ